MVKRNFFCVQKIGFYYCDTTKCVEFYPARVLAFHSSPALGNEAGDEMSTYEREKEFRIGVKRLTGGQEYLQQEKSRKEDPDFAICLPERMTGKHQCPVHNAIN
ncbi:hypothetical protein AVEN_151793-1 [Araneus ventricosus]|uniref:Uncharacterized protein n=1 Tax=Araneus ventricosus TaxID=182803 RepID=A0A4Y2QKZ9_ARAVE|nr:hypothetical protein AVEN_111042-1 [Araneus ventricosus]GBN63889.1 hypothetical protein AVEN_151793-1 [Araneus ventricosus]